MNALEFAFYREARNRMTAEELETAKALAVKAERGDRRAEEVLKEMVEHVFWDKSRIESPGC